jgi:hypothetical protein
LLLAIATTSLSSSTSTSWSASIPTPWATSSSAATRGFSFPIFTIAKLWLDKATTERVVFVDDLADLLQLMPKANIPEGLGGDLKERQPDFEIFPKKTGGWFSGWFGGAQPDSAAASSNAAAAAADDDEDPLAGLTGDARAAKIAEIEKAELEGAKKIEADAAARDAAKAASNTKQRRRRRKNKR